MSKLKIVASALVPLGVLVCTEMAESSVLEEIIVTAQKREQNLQDVPISVSALSGSLLEQARVQDLLDMESLVPNFRAVGGQTGGNFYIRGVGANTIGNGSDNSIAVQKDGVFLSRARGVLSSFYDIDRIEVLRGPQGTLYGRNATGGVINIYSKRPTNELEAYISAMVGNYDQTEFEGAVSGAIVEGKLNGRLAALSRKRDGFDDNILLDKDVNDLDQQAVRGSIDFNFSDSVNLLLQMEYLEQDDNSGEAYWTGDQLDGAAPLIIGLARGGSLGPSIHKSNNNTLAETVYETTDALADLTIDINEQWQFKSVTGYRKIDFNRQGDLDFTEIDAVTQLSEENSEQISQEFRLHYNTDDFNGVLGIYYFEEDIDAINDLSTILGFHQQGIAETEARAVFTNGTWHLGDFTVDVGLRWNEEDRFSEGTFTFIPLPTPTGSVPTGGSETFEDVTGGLTVSWNVNDDIMMYGSYKQGFKSGLFIIGANNPPIEPEHIDAFEIGLKSQFFEGKVQANLSAFYYDYTDLQVSRIVEVGGVATTLTENAAEATSQGFEAEINVAPWDGFIGMAVFSYLDAEFDDYPTLDPVDNSVEINLAGNKLPYAPEFSWTLVGSQELSLGDAGILELSGEVNWTDQMYFTPANSSKQEVDSQYRVNARITYRPHSDLDWYISLWGRNLTDEEYETSRGAQALQLGGAIPAQHIDPVTYGLQIGIEL